MPTRKRKLKTPVCVLRFAWKSNIPWIMIIAPIKQPKTRKNVYIYIYTSCWTHTKIPIVEHQIVFIVAQLLSRKRSAVCSASAWHFAWPMSSWGVRFKRWTSNTKKNTFHIKQTGVDESRIKVIGWCWSWRHKFDFRVRLCPLLVGNVSRSNG